MFDSKRPFTRADAVAAGISPRRLSGSRYRRVFRGVYICADVPPHQHQRIVGGLLLHPPSARASHLSGAQICGVAVPEHSTVHISVPLAKDRRWQPGLKPHVSPLHVKAITWKGVSISDPVRMFVELASILDLVDLVVAGDSILRVFKLTAAEFRRSLDEVRDYWSPAARYAAQFLRDEVDSPMESRLRMLIVLAGLPEPQVNFKLRNRDGDVIVRFDLSYPHLRLAVEYDGRHHVDIRSHWEDDLDRREFLDGIEWRVIKVVARGIFVEPWRTIQRVATALRERGAVLGPLSSDWRPFFPGRRSTPAV